MDKHQLRKPPTVEINPENPFEHDILKQRPAIELLTKLVQSTEQPFVFSIEAPWGWGKTKFVERWKAHLTKENHTCLYFNAWEHDFVDDPLVAFLGALGPVVRATGSGGKRTSPLGKKLSKVQELGGKLVKKGVPIIVKAVARKIAGSETVKEVSELVAESADSIADLLSEEARKRIALYEKEKNGIEAFKIALKELAEKLTEAEDKKKQVVIFVDELDRCRPDFAMTLLERIKHLFSVQGMVFVLSMDRGQLRNTVHYLYGAGDNAEAYLRRFIDFSYSLPKPEVREFANILSERFKIIDVFQNRNTAQVAWDRFLPAFVETAKWLNMDLRTQEQCFTRLNAIIRLWPREHFLQTDALCVLVGLRVSKPDIYKSFQEGGPISEDFVSDLGPASKQFRIVANDALTAVFAEEQSVAAQVGALEQQRAIRPHTDRAPLKAFFYSRKLLIELLDFTGNIQ